MCASVTQLCTQLFVTPRTVVHQLPLWDVYRQEYWSGLPFPSTGDLSDPGIEPAFPKSPVLAGIFFTAEQPGILIVYFKEE